MTDEQPEPWAVELLNDILNVWGPFGSDTAALTLQRAFVEREADMVGARNRTLEDHGRMLWRDDVEGHCVTPDMCFEYGDTVRCSPCAIKQSAAAGVMVRNPDNSYSPEVCRLRREIAVLVAALKPFASMAAAYDPDDGDGDQWAFASRPTVGQVRAARAALKSREAGHG